MSEYTTDSNSDSIYLSLPYESTFERGLYNHKQYLDLPSSNFHLEYYKYETYDGERYVRILKRCPSNITQRYYLHKYKLFEAKRFLYIRLIELRKNNLNSTWSIAVKYKYRGNEKNMEFYNNDANKVYEWMTL